MNRASRVSSRRQSNRQAAKLLPSIRQCGVEYRAPVPRYSQRRLQHKRRIPSDPITFQSQAELPSPSAIDCHRQIGLGLPRDELVRASSAGGFFHGKSQSNIANKKKLLRLRREMRPEERNHPSPNPPEKIGVCDNRGTPLSASPAPIFLLPPQRTQRGGNCDEESGIRKNALRVRNGLGVRQRRAGKPAPIPGSAGRPCRRRSNFVARPRSRSKPPAFHREKKKCIANRVIAAIGAPKSTNASIKTVSILERQRGSRRHSLETPSHRLKVE